MSFILHIFEAPSVTTLAAATAHCYADLPPPATPNETFARFIAEVTRLYPDLSEEDEDGDNDANLWSEGFMAGPVTGRVLTVAVKTGHVASHVLNNIALMAASAGLQMLDPQNGMLYRHDGVIMTAQGRYGFVSGLRLRAHAAPEPEWSDYQFPSHQLLHDYFASRFAADGFQPTDVGAGFGHASRLLGETRQTLVFSVSLRGDARAVSASLAIAAGRVSFYWKSLFSPRIEQLLSYSRTLCERDFTVQLAELLPVPPPGATRDAAPTLVASREEMLQWAERFGDWYEHEGRAALNRLNDLRVLGKVILTPERLALARRERYPAQTVMSTLVLARALERPDIDLWTDAFWQRQQENPSRDWADLLHEPDADTLRQLIDHLRAPAFRFDIDSPRWPWPGRAWQVA